MASAILPSGRAASNDSFQHTGRAFRDIRFCSRPCCRTVAAGLYRTATYLDPAKAIATPDVRVPRLTEKSTHFRYGDRRLSVQDFAAVPVLAASCRPGECGAPC